MMQSQTYQTQPTMRRPQFKIIDDEFNWYKPVAVILKPASKRDLQQRLLQINFDKFLLASYPPSLLPPWPFVQDYSAYFRRWINYQSSDRLRDVYRRYELAGHVERRLTFLGRMGLVAIPKVKKINRQRSGNNRNQEQQMAEQSKIIFLNITLTSVCVLMCKDLRDFSSSRAFPNSQSLRFLFREKG